MLNNFRAFSTSITTKILLVLLIASFAMWGVGDMLGKSVGSTTLVKVGGQAIAVDAYRRELAMESDNIRRQLGASYSQELLKRLNVPQFVLQRMVQESLLRQEAERMGFIPDDTTVALEIRKNPIFFNHSGVFDKARFESALRTQGMSEKSYVENVRMQLATDKLLNALAINVPVSNTMFTHLQAAATQGRRITLYTLAADTLAAAAPTDAELAAFHKEHAEQFTAPELRTVSFIRFTTNDLQPVSASISEEAVRSYYNAHTEQFRIGEKREVEQLLYNNEDKVREAYELVKLGKKFAEIAESVEPQNRRNMSLGLVEKKALPESAADSVFRLKAGGFTEPMQTPFGWHIFRVVLIEPEGVQPLEKVRSAIETQIKQSAEDNALSDKMNQLEDALAGGSTLQEAAKSLGMTVEQAGTFDKEGNTPQGTPGNALPQLDKFLDVAFKTDEKTESSVITSKGGTYYVLRVDAITPEKLRPLDEAKSEVRNALLQQRSNRQLDDIASLIEKEQSTGKSASAIIATHKLTAAAEGTVVRTSKSLGDFRLPPSLLTHIFSANIGGLTSPIRDKSNHFLLAEINGVTAGAAPSSADTGAQKKELQQQMQEEIMAQYVRYLETLYPVTIHEEIFDRLIRDSSDVAR